MDRMQKNSSYKPSQRPKSLFVARALAWSFAFLAGTSAFAATYPLRDNTEIIYLQHARGDYEVRNALIRQARKSIDFLSFSQLSDGVGTTCLESVRSAQVSRNVPVRGIYDWMASF